MTLPEILLLLIGGASGAAVILGPNRRWRLAGLSGSILVQAAALWMHGAAVSASSRWIAGWIACAILLVTVVRKGLQVSEPGTERAAFRWIAVLLVGAAAGGLGWISWTSIAQIPLVPAVLSGMWIGMGLAGLGLASEAFGAGTSLLLAMVGFEVAYGLMETSLAVLALLAGIQVGISLVISYMLDAAGRDEAVTR